MYPVAFEDMKKLYGATNYKAYDSHFAPVVPASPNPNESVYLALKPGQQVTAERFW